jgi:hypothetical protein
MKKLRSIIACAVALFSVASAEITKVPIGDLDTQNFQSGGLLINNFNFVIEEALMGGHKASVQCSVKNKTDEDANYTIYISAYDANGTLIACFGMEPMMNIHEAGKVEMLEDSGMVEKNYEGKIDHVLIKVVLQ